MSKLLETLERIYAAPAYEDLLFCLGLSEPRDLHMLFSFADEVRRDFAGDGILLRGLVEISNVCQGDCFYCGLQAGNERLERYRLSDEEILAAVARAVSFQIRTVVLQSGQDAALDPARFRDLVKLVKQCFDIAVTLSLGEKTKEEYRMWREAGADRYLLKIESSDPGLYRSTHKTRGIENRLRCLEDLRELGYQVGSGIMVGLPGQTIASLAKDILFFKERDFDMIGIGPFIPHPETVFAGMSRGDVTLTLKVIALTRIATRNSHMPATTALGSLDRDYRPQGLKAGANVLMPNFTPRPYNGLYQIYPGKRCLKEETGKCVSCAPLLSELDERYFDFSVGHSLKQ